MTHKKVDNADAGTADKFGGNDLDKWSDFASGVDVDDYTIGSDVTFTRDPVIPRYLIASAKYYIYKDANDSNKFKARNCTTGVIDYTSTDSTDAAAVIRSAISAGSNAPGKILLAGNTTFPLVSTAGSPARHITLLSGQWLQGCGWSSLLQGRAGLGENGANIIVNPRDATSVIVSDLSIDGQNTNGTNNTSAAGGNLHCVNCDLLVVNNVRSINSPERGINAYNCKHVFFTNNYVEVTQLASDFLGYAGLQCVAASEECIMSGNIVKNPGGPSLGVNSGTKKINIVNNISIVTTDSPLFHERGRGQIHIESLGAGDPRDSELIIANNNLNTNYFGMILMGSFHADIHDNIINSTNHETATVSLANDYSGIRILGQGLAYNIKIHNNDIYNTKGHGIYVNNAVSMIDITNNMIRNVSGQTINTYDGIYLEVNTDNLTICRIQNNDIYDDRAASKRMRDGIRVSVSSARTLSNFILINNQIIGQTGTALNVINSGTITYAASNQIPLFQMTQGGTSSTTYAVRYSSPGSLLLTGTEATVQQTCPNRVRVTRIITKMSSNSVTGNTTISLRDDGADVTGSLFTIAAADTTEKDSGALNAVIEANSKINFKIDATASTSGNWLFAYFIVYGYVE